MSEQPKTQKGWRILRRGMVGLAVLVTLIAIFYTEENWRGKRAWLKCKAELEAKGVVLDWNKYIPPSLPDDQNFFGDSRMAEWFIKRTNGFTGRYTNEWNGIGTNSLTYAKITDTNAAASYLLYSDRFTPVFDEVRVALKRPYAIIPGDYSQPFLNPVVNFVTLRSQVQVLAQRAKCYLLLGQPDKALRELTLMHDICRILQKPPTGKPILLVEAMINVAISGLYTSVVEEGFRLKAWREPQIIALQEQCREKNLVSAVADSFSAERAASTYTIENTSASKIAEFFDKPAKPGQSKPGFWKKIRNPAYLFFKFCPRGWIYQNMVTVVTSIRFESQGETSQLPISISPRFIEQSVKDVEKSLNHATFFNVWARVSIPNFARAWQTTTYNQTLVNEAQIACALERYKLVNGSYPETLEALVPQFIGRIPDDFIGGQPLHYRRTEDGKFRLYSVGWNETDDGGVTVKDKSGNEERTQGDWVWKN